MLGKLSYVLIFAILCQRMVVIDGGRYCTAFDCNYKIEHGILRGIHVTEDTYLQYERMKEIANEYVDDQDKILFISQGEFTFAYSMSNAEICAPGNEYTSWDNEYYLDYYNNNSNKIPTKIIIIGENEIQQFENNCDDLFMEYVRSNYYVTHQEKDVKVLEKN